MLCCKIATFESEIVRILEKCVEKKQYYLLLLAEMPDSCSKAAHVNRLINPPRLVEIACSTS